MSLNAADDALHANGDVTVSDGSYDLSTGDDGVHADGILSISGGTVVVRTSYEGLEGTDVSISGGDIRSRHPMMVSTPRAAATPVRPVAGEAPTAFSRGAIIPSPFRAAPS